MSAATTLAPQKVKTYSFRELLNHPRHAETNSLIAEGILKNNSMFVLGGPPKAYKSFLTLTAAADLAIGASSLYLAHRTNHGRQQPAFEITKACRVLVMEQEVGEDDLEERLKPLYESLPPEHQEMMLNNLFTHSLDHTLNLDKKDGYAAICDIISQVKPDVLMMDPLIEFHTSNENDTQAMSYVMKNLSLIRQSFDPLAIWLSHHEGKETMMKREGADRLRGNSVIYGKGDTFLMIHVANRNAMVVNCEFTLRRGRPIRPFSVKVDETSLRVGFNKWGKSKVSADDQDEAREAKSLSQMVI